jgi:hypothetical protein
MSHGGRPGPPGTPASLSEHQPRCGGARTRARYSPRFCALRACACLPRCRCSRSARLRGDRSHGHATQQPSGMYAYAYGAGETRGCHAACGDSTCGSPAVGSRCMQLPGRRRGDGALVSRRVHIVAQIGFKECLASHACACARGRVARRRAGPVQVRSARTCRCLHACACGAPCMSDRSCL